jgi:hypothetical protein
MIREQSKRSELGWIDLLLVIVLLSLLLFLPGCGSIVPSERKARAAAAESSRITAAHSAEITKQAENIPPPISVSVSGTNNTTSLSIEPSRTITRIRSIEDSAASDRAESSERSSSSIPAGVKLILIAIGLALILGVIGSAIWIARRNSIAAAAAFSAGDRAFASLIGQLESRIRIETDQSRLSDLNSQLAAIEKERGKFHG